MYYDRKGRAGKVFRNESVALGAAQVAEARRKGAAAAAHVADNCELMHLSEASLLENLRARYADKREPAAIYTLTACAAALGAEERPTADTSAA